MPLLLDTTKRRMKRTWFSDEKKFSGQPPSNTQNDRIYRNVKRKRDIPPQNLLRTRAHFGDSVMVSVAASKMGRTNLFVCEPRAKINAEYYRDYILDQHLFPQIKKISRHNFLFQQDGATSSQSSICSRQMCILLPQSNGLLILPT